MSKRARMFIRLVVGGGVVAIVLSLALGGGWTLDNPRVFLAVVAAVIVAERFVIHLTFAKESLSLSGAELVITYALVTMPHGPLVLAAALGMAGGQAIRRRPPVKATYNTAMYAIGAAAAGAVYHRLGAGSVVEPYTWMAAVTAMAAFQIVNQILVSLVVALAEGQRFLHVSKVGAPVIASVWAGNVSLGMVAAHLAATEPAALSLLVVPSALGYAAHRAWIHSKAENRKMQDLHRVGALLIGALGEETFAPFLKEIAAMLRANGAELLAFEGPRSLRVIRETGESELRNLATLSSEGLSPLTAVNAYARSNGWRSWMVAPLVGEEGVSGALVVHGHMGAEGPAEFPKQDQALLQTLANEASIQLRTIGLFRSVSEERSKLKDIVEHTTDGIYQVTPDRRIVSWNPAMESITGYSAAEAIGQMCFNIVRARDGRGVDMCSGDCPILAACESHATQERDAQIMTRDAVPRWIRYCHSPIVDDEGRVISDVIVVRDATADRALLEAKDDFIGTVSHELRTPLTPIKGFLVTLLNYGESFSPEQRRDFYVRMSNQTERLCRLVENLLEVSQMESGQLSVRNVPTDVAAVVSRLASEYRDLYPERQFVLSVQEAVPRAMADETRLERTLFHLVDNAVRYSPDAEPIELSVAREGDEVVAGIRDRGPGIPYSEQEKVFDRFYRIGHYMTREQSGTGLGLFVARELALAMGGRITLQSRVGQGSTFSVHLTVPGEGGRVLPITGRSA